jgi:4-hydroxy-3-polyprenylbenzoate decarboxylase
MKREIKYDSLRDWLKEIEALGELRTVRGASWQEEIGALTDVVQHDETAPAVLFDEIPGYPKGFRVLSNAFGGKRQNVILGFSPALSKVELSQVFLGEYRDAKSKRTPFEHVETGPVFENVIEGDAVDVTRFPTPIW